MRTRSQSKQPQSKGEKEGVGREHLRLSEKIENEKAHSSVCGEHAGEICCKVDGVFDKEDTMHSSRRETSAMSERKPREMNKESSDNTGEKDSALPVFFYKDAAENAFPEVKVEQDACGDSEPYEEQYDSDWEDGFIPASLPSDFQEEFTNGFLVDFDVSTGLDKRKGARRATAADKEMAEIMHKVHLLCLLGRGRLIDNACNDPLIQASLFSMVPIHLLNTGESPNLTASHLSSLVDWFHNNFRVNTSGVADKPCHVGLSSTLETREGTPEMVTALSVALFRALNMTTRFVSVLDVISLKPEVIKSECTFEVGKGKKDIFNSSTLMVAEPSFPIPIAKSFLEVEDSCPTALRSTALSKASKSKEHGFQSQESQVTDTAADIRLGKSFDNTSNDISIPCSIKSETLKRKGDIEYQMQLEMALSATAAGCSPNVLTYNVSESASSSPVSQRCRRVKKIKIEESQTTSCALPTAIGSRKVGAPLYWAEIYCSGDNLTGKWVHVDTVNAIVDGESRVETAVASCKKSLRYVVAFAGNGAKDVTRRYCTKWYKVSSRRVDSTWWDSVLARLKDLESAATCGNAKCDIKSLGNEKNQECAPRSMESCGKFEQYGEQNAVKSSTNDTTDATRSSLEDMELEIRALTEPLPTNQLAYKNHPLYVIERWLRKYEFIYPKGPVLGFCSGHAVYPRTCVHVLHTRKMWLREGLQVKADVHPSKVLKSSKHRKEKNVEDDEYAFPENEKTVDLYGKWQTEPLCLPRAVNGIVPKNERGQVEVWSEKCLPPGTVHLGFPRIAPVANRLGIDFAPAMVGFESRSDRSIPVFDGIVVCQEFKDALLEAYAEEDERRDMKEKRRNELRALSRWYQLLSSIVTRQRLNNSYANAGTSAESIGVSESVIKCKNLAVDVQECKKSHHCQKENSQGIIYVLPSENHEHEFKFEVQANDGDGLTRVKRCHCGFSIEFEEL